MQVLIDREKAGELGVSAGQIGQSITQLLIWRQGRSVTNKMAKIIDIYVRFNKASRYNSSALFNQSITFRTNTGKLREIPVSTVASQKNNSGFSAIKHKQSKRIVTLYSALSPGYTDAGAAVAQVKNEMRNIEGIPDSVKIDYTGQLEKQNKEQAFLMGALL